MSRIVRNKQGEKVLQIVPDNVAPWQWTQGFDFVITRKGELRIGKGHGFLAGQRNASTNPEILGAGKLKVDRNTMKITHVNGHSGHFRPDLTPGATEMIIQKFRDEGLYY